MSTNPVDHLLTVAEIAERLNVSESFVYGKIASGELRHFRLGGGQGGIRVSLEQLADFLTRKERGGHEPKPEPAPETTKVSANSFTVLDTERLKEAWGKRHG